MDGLRLCRATLSLCRVVRELSLIKAYISELHSKLNQDESRFSSDSTCSAIKVSLVSKSFGYGYFLLFRRYSLYFDIIMLSLAQ